MMSVNGLVDRQSRQAGAIANLNFPRSCLKTYRQCDILPTRLAPGMLPAVEFGEIKPEQEEFQINMLLHGQL